MKYIKNENVMAVAYGLDVKLNTEYLLETVENEKTIISLKGMSRQRFEDCAYKFLSVCCAVGKKVYFTEQDIKEGTHNDLRKLILLIEDSDLDNKLNDNLEFGDYLISQGLTHFGVTKEDGYFTFGLVEKSSLEGERGLTEYDISDLNKPHLLDMVNRTSSNVFLKEYKDLLNE